MARGLDYDLNWALAGDRLTTRGEAYRNASIRDLLEFAPRAGHAVTKEKALVCTTPQPQPCPAFATDALPGTQASGVGCRRLRVEVVFCGKHPMTSPTPAHLVSRSFFLPSFRAYVSCARTPHPAAPRRGGV